MVVCMVKTGGVMTYYAFPQLKGSLNSLDKDEDDVKPF